MFLVGKINAAKLLNFPEIDVFVLVACPENSLLDSKALFKPVVTPFELELALCEGREWDGHYSADFRDLLEWSSVDDGTGGAAAASGEDAAVAGGGEQNRRRRRGDRGPRTDRLVRPIALADEADAEVDGDDDDDDGVYMSLVDGRLHTRRGRLFQQQEEENKN